MHCQLSTGRAWVSSSFFSAVKACRWGSSKQIVWQESRSHTQGPG
jgi:hypothetical protein